MWFNPTPFCPWEMQTMSNTNTNRLLSSHSFSHFAKWKTNFNVWTKGWRCSSSRYVLKMFEQYVWPYLLFHIIKFLLKSKKNRLDILWKILTLFVQHSVFDWHLVTSDGHLMYSEVRTFLKRQHIVNSMYREITISSNDKIQLSGKHLIYARRNSTAKFNIM